MKRFLKITLFTIILFLVGIIKVNAAENIAITDVELQDKSEYVIINEEVSLDNNKITSNVVFYDEGDYVIYKLTIKNNDDQDYRIEDILDDNTSEYLSFEYDYEDGVIGAKSEKEVLLKITYVSLLPYDSVLTPEHTFNATTEVNISFKLTDYVKNPSTLDRIGKQSFTVILCVLLLFAFVKLRKSKFLYVLVLGLFLIPIGTNAEREITLNITFKNSIEAEVNFLSNRWKTIISGEYSKIEFVKRASFPSDAVDVSQEQDNSIKAWIEDGTLYFGSRYKIFFPVDSNYLFSNLSLSSIEFNNRVDTTFVVKMDHLLSYNAPLQSIDVSSFRTGNVTESTQMFQYDSSLKELDVSNFDMSNNKYIFDMFAGCNSLETLNIDNWDLSKMEYTARLVFPFKGNLKVISAKNLILPKDSSYFFENPDNYNNYPVLEIIDLTGSDSSLVTNMDSMFRAQTGLKEIRGIEDWDTSNVTDMDNMFNRAFFKSEDAVIDLDLSNWDISNVTSMTEMFYNFGYYVKEFNLTINGWENSNVTSLENVFRNIGYTSSKTIINIDGFSFSEVTNLRYGLYGIGYNAGEVEININDFSMPKLNVVEDGLESIGIKSNTVTLNLENFYIPNVQNVKYLFEYVGEEANYVNISLKNWDMSNCLTPTNMFYYSAFMAKEEVNITLENIDLSNATYFRSMFYSVGRDVKNLNIKLTNVDTASAENMDYMFCYAGMFSENATFEGLDGLDLSNVPSMDSFMHEIGYNKPNVRNFGTLNIYGGNLYHLMSYVTGLKGTINLYGNPTSSSYIFENSAITDDSEIVINYTSDVDIDAIMSNIGENSHIYKGQLIEV